MTNMLECFLGVENEATLKTVAKKPTIDRATIGFEKIYSDLRASIQRKENKWSNSSVEEDNETDAQKIEKETKEDEENTDNTYQALDMSLSYLPYLEMKLPAGESAKVLKNMYGTGIDSGTSIHPGMFFVAHNDENLSLESDMSQFDVIMEEEQSEEVIFLNTEEQPNDSMDDRFPIRDEVIAVDVPSNLSTDLADGNLNGVIDRPGQKPTLSGDFDQDLNQEFNPNIKILERHKDGVPLQSQSSGQRQDNQNVDEDTLDINSYEREDDININELDRDEELTRNVEEVSRRRQNLKMRTDNSGLDSAVLQETQDEVSYIEDNSSMINTQKSMDVISRLSDEIYASIHENKSEIVVHLKPDFLGKVTLKIWLNRDVLSAKIVAETQETMNIISTRLDELEYALSEKGYTIGNLDVDINQSGSQPYQFYSEQQNGPTHGLEHHSSNCVVSDSDLGYDNRSHSLSSAHAGSIDYFA